MAERPLPHLTRRLLPGDDLLAALDRWVAAARSDEAAAARSRERWLRQVADESASFAGTLLDLAERGAPVLVHGAGGRRHRGVLAGVGTDFVALRLAAGDVVLLATEAIGAVRVDGSDGGPLGDRDVELAVGLAEAVAALAEDRPRVLVVTTASDEGVVGELRAVGTDVATIALDGAGRPTAYVPLAAVAEIRLA